jgi:hypothetical protein
MLNKNKKVRFNVAKEIYAVGAFIALASAGLFLVL